MRGMGHPLVRRLFAELGRRFVAGGAIGQADEIYWLRAERSGDADRRAIERGGQRCPTLAERIPERKQQGRPFSRSAPR